MFHVARPLCAIFYRGARLGEVANRSGKIGYGGMPPASNVENPGCLGFQGEERIGRDYIRYINEVSRLPAVSENRNRLVSDCFLNKSRNDRGVFTSRILIGTKDVKIAQGNSGESPFTREAAAMPFCFMLACGIGTFRLGRHAFNFWNGWIVAVNCSRAA